MAEYLVSGVTPAGRRVTEWIDADSADLAVKTLRDQGYEQIVLHTDDLAARYLNEGKNRHESSINPREWADLKYVGQLGWFFFLLRKLYMQACNWLWCLVLPLAVLFYRRYLDCPWDI